MAIYIRHNILWFYERIGKKICVKHPENGDDILLVSGHDIADYLEKTQDDGFYYYDKSQKLWQMVMVECLLKNQSLI